MKRFLFFIFLLSLTGLMAQPADSLLKKRQFHFDVSVYTMVPFIYGAKLTPSAPGVKLVYGGINYRDKNKFRDWEINAGMSHLQSPMFPAYSTQSGHYYPPSWTPQFLGYRRYKYHFAELAFEYKFGHSARENKSGFFWSFGPAVQMVFLWSYKPIEAPSYYSSKQPNRFGNIIVTDFSVPALAAVFEAGILKGSSKSKSQYRFSVFGSVPITPSNWRLPYDNTSTTSGGFPFAVGLRAGIQAEKKTVTDSAGKFLPAYIEKKRFIVYSEILGAGIGLSANLEVKIVESKDRFFAFYGRAGISYTFDSSPGGFAGIHTTIGRKKNQFDAGVCVITISRENALLLSIGARFNGEKGFFIRPAFTPFFYGRIIPYGGLSIGYSWSHRKRVAK